MNTLGSLSQNLNNFIYHTFCSDNAEILNFYDGSTFTSRITLFVPSLRFLSDKWIEL